MNFEWLNSTLDDTPAPVVVALGTENFEDIVLADRQTCREVRGELFRLMGLSTPADTLEPVADVARRLEKQFGTPEKYRAALAEFAGRARREVLARIEFM